MIEIQSRDNTHFKRWQDLDSSRGLKKHSEFFLMGEKLIREFLKNPRFKVKAEVICEGHSPIAANSAMFNRLGKVSLFKLSKPLFNEIDFVGTHFNLLVLELPELPEYDFDLPPAGLELITPLGDPSNLGALVRSALAFSASKVILTQEAAHAFLPKAVKASAGAVLTLPLYRQRKALAELASATGELFALDMQGTPAHKMEWPKNLRLLLGEEGAGIPEGVRGLQKISIPTGPIESLNATVAASIALYNYHLQHS